MTVERMSWDDYFLGIATAVAVRADCSRSQVGAVAVRGNRIIATGYNGTERGSALSCLAGHCPRVAEAPSPYSPYGNCIATHAEANCAQYIHDAFGADMEFSIYVTRMPCRNCFAMLRTFPYIERIVWPEGNLHL